jgi:dihydrofolate synthase/folylpolyglutamate synthase
MAKPSAADLLQAREAIGWKLGLERMRRLCSLLGLPQHRFASIHVVGTNGKTSVTRMTTALLEAHGVRAGAYVSPHISSWRERILIGGEPIPEPAFEQSLERAEQAAEVADRAAGEEGPVTQFELVTAAAFWALAEARVQAAVIEAGLGGRLDATNVIPSKVAVLTSVGLDHTEWLGETLAEIAAEKLAVLRDHATLIAPPLAAEAEAVLDREVERRHAQAVRVTEPPGRSALETDGSSGGVATGIGLGYQARNLALAIAATRAVLGRFEPDSVAAAGPRLAVPGRAEVIEGDPPMILDAAHNPDGARALAATLPSLAQGLEVVCCLAILAEKDAAAMIEALAPVCGRFVCTEVPEETIRGSGRPVGSSQPAEELARFCRDAGAAVEVVTGPDLAWERAKQLARERHGVALATGSHYLLTSVWTERRAASY